MRPVTWRLFAVVGAALGLYAALGFWLAENGVVEEWMYRIGLTVCTLTPLLFVIVYTIYGLRGHGRHGKWWTNPIGTSLVVASLSVSYICAPLAYVFWFMNGQLSASWLAWLEVSAPCVAALAWLALAWVWTVIYHYEPPPERHRRQAD